MHAILLFFLFGVSARAAEAPDYEREEFNLLGWSDGCSVAVAHYGYPKTGAALADEPVMTRIGILSVAPGQTKEKDGWLITLHGPWTWKPGEAKHVLQKLNRHGFVKPGVMEEVGANPVVPERDLPRLLSTTDTLKAVPGKAWPNAGWRWRAIHYEPYGTCALLLYEKRIGEKPFYNYLLARIGNPAARSDRARAHLANAELLLDRGDLASAVSESAVAVKLAPDSAPGRYRNAALMALSGIVEPAIDELEAAIKLDSQYKRKARDDKDFEALHWHPKFKELTR